MFVVQAYLSDRALAGYRGYREFDSRIHDTCEKHATTLIGVIFDGCRTSSVIRTRVTAYRSYFIFCL